MKQEAPQPRRSRTGIPAIHGGEHVKYAHFLTGGSQLASVASLFRLFWVLDTAISSVMSLA